MRQANHHTCTTASVALYHKVSGGGRLSKCSSISTLSRKWRDNEKKKEMGVLIVTNTMNAKVTNQYESQII